MLWIHAIVDKIFTSFAEDERQQDQSLYMKELYPSIVSGIIKTLALCICNAAQAEISKLTKKVERDSSITMKVLALES